MPQVLEIQVAEDHLMSITKASAHSAISELIWNSLDADAEHVWLLIQSSDLGAVDRIVVEDDGHGIPFNEAADLFTSLGNSPKKLRYFTPQKRILHGKEGKGRFKAFALGHSVEFESHYNDNGSLMRYTIAWTRDRIKSPIIGDPKPSTRAKSGVIVRITDVLDKKIKDLLVEDYLEQLERMFAVYFHSFPSFTISYNECQLDFSHQIQRRHMATFHIPSHTEHNGDAIHFQLNIIEWHSRVEPELYLCGAAGATYSQKRSTGLTYMSYSAFLCSQYIDRLYESGQLDLNDLDEVMVNALKRSEDIIRSYGAARRRQMAQDYIRELKDQQLYPYANEPQTLAEEAERQIFDITAVTVRDYLPRFETQPPENKQLTFALMRQALESGTHNLNRVMREVIKLPSDKINEWAKLLDRTPLSDMIDTFNEINHRLRLITELRQLIYDREISKKVLERKQFHRIIVNELWLFGDDYALGTDDVSLRNVLRAHLKLLGKTDFIEATSPNENDEMSYIPDITIWRQYARGGNGKLQHLVVELKRPKKTVTAKELQQVEQYALAISSDSRFDKVKVKWSIVLMATDLDEYVYMKSHQKDRQPGLAHADEHIEIWVHSWGDLLSEAEARHQYLKDKINVNIRHDDGLVLLKEKYREYLPDDI